MVQCAQLWVGRLPARCDHPYLVESEKRHHAFRTEAHCRRGNHAAMLFKHCHHDNPVYRYPKNMTMRKGWVVPCYDQSPSIVRVLVHSLGTLMVNPALSGKYGWGHL